MGWWIRVSVTFFFSDHGHHKTFVLHVSCLLVIDPVWSDNTFHIWWQVRTTSNIPNTHTCCRPLYHRNVSCSNHGIRLVSRNQPMMYFLLPSVRLASGWQFSQSGNLLVHHSGAEKKDRRVAGRQYSEASLITLDSECSNWEHATCGQSWMWKSPFGNSQSQAHIYSPLWMALFSFL